MTIDPTRRAAGAPAAPAAGLDDETMAAIVLAALWLATTSREDRRRPVVPLLRERFKLSAPQACEAIRRAQLIRARAT